MTTYKYSLAKKGKWICPECGKKTFVCYVDEAGNVLNERVGKCDRADHCGHHYTPRDYFNENPNAPQAHQSLKTHRPQPLPQPSYMKSELMKQSLRHFDNNNFTRFLKSKFGKTLANEMIERYFIGTSKHWPGATVFWQLDGYGRVHAGKVMLYDEATGKRVKEPSNCLTWAHSALKLDNFNLSQCLFGEHLLKNDPRPVLVHESEKTAIIAGSLMTDYISVACGGLTNLTRHRCSALMGRDVILCPDNGCFDKWKDVVTDTKKFPRFFFKSLKISTYMESHSTNKGDDIADVILSLMDSINIVLP